MNPLASAISLRTPPLRRLDSFRKERFLQETLAIAGRRPWQAETPPRGRARTLSDPETGPVRATGSSDVDCVDSWGWLVSLVSVKSYILKNFEKS